MIIVKLPSKKEKKFTVHVTDRKEEKFVKAVGVVTYIKKLIVGPLKGQKTSVIIKDDEGYSNSTNPTDNVEELIFDLECFLEDYL